MRINGFLGELVKGITVMNEYSYNFVLLEPGDIVTVSDPAIGFLRYPVRIQTISENDAGDLDIEAEECPSGTGQGIIMAAQTNGAVLQPGADVDPGPIN